MLMLVNKRGKNDIKAVDHRFSVYLAKKECQFYRTISMRLSVCKMRFGFVAVNEVQLTSKIGEPYVSKSVGFFSVQNRKFSHNKIIRLKIIKIRKMFSLLYIIFIINYAC